MNLRSPIIALIIASAIWGATAPIIKWSLGNIPLFSLAFLRFSIATIVFLPFAYRFLRISLSDLPRIILAGLFGVTLNITFFFLGLQRTTAINAVVLINTTGSIFTILGASLFLKEKVSSKVIVGVGLSIIGILVILVQPIIEGETQVHLLGDFLLILGALFWVTYELVSKKLFKIYNPRTIIFYSFLIGAISFFPLAIKEFISQPEWIQNLNVRGIVGIIYGALFASTIAYSFWQWGLSKMEISQAGVFFYLEPIVGALVAIPLLGEKITLPFLAGTAFILLGIYIAEKRLPYQALRRHLNLKPTETKDA